MTDDPIGRTLRGAALQEACLLTEGSRNDTYGDPVQDLGCAHEIIAVLTRYLQRDLCGAEAEALRRVAMKLSRIVTGHTVHRDNYVDAAAYIAIAYEAAARDLAGDEANDAP